jgi:hypothetical protein
VKRDWVGSGLDHNIRVKLRVNFLRGIVRVQGGRSFDVIWYEDRCLQLTHMFGETIPSEERYD